MPRPIICQFRLRPHQLGEHQVDDLGHIDPGVEHVHGDGDVRGLVALGEFVDQILGESLPVGDDLGELPSEFREERVEALRDGLGVVVVPGKDDRLTETVPAFNLRAVRHQRDERLVDGVLVEQELVDLIDADLIGEVVVLRPVDRVPLLLVLI
ncbi:hypothetical protein [Planotetraspora sp. GP83]|uniref:hypothetical protein n=1 Tax=Planotetraspora sp. GP83 TaxID=3156264 RepID=UPI003512B9FA